jgi:thiamine biosynthesis lipoprotein ApbE
MSSYVNILGMTSWSSASTPTKIQVREVLECAGWTRVSWRRPRLRLQAGMEIDFGGFGKEYAVDRALELAAAHATGAAAGLLELSSGALATSGVVHIFDFRHGKAAEHLNRTGPYALHGCTGAHLHFEVFAGVCSHRQYDAGFEAALRPILENDLAAVSLNDGLSRR